MEVLQKLENAMIDTVEAMMNDFKKREETFIRKVGSLKDEINELKLILKTLLDASTIT